LKSDVLEKLSTAAWYLHSTRDGKLFFKNIQNLIAKLEGLVKTYASAEPGYGSVMTSVVSSCFNSISSTAGRIWAF
jgi:hypothetical protein